MSERDRDGTPQRRGFLKALGLAAGGAAVAGVAEAADPPSRADAVPPGMARKENPQQRVAARYRETDHVKAFYATNRY
ncbi:twin-arginine translocation signal domain-containing protein [Roseomonas sp. BN140053]|uniref:twin-arginine translocation signal domain-containing protein n=1 Tax=Roseomonas sp. BN140053 TaxID=3391898 RepID=UPI0039ED7610